MNLARRDNLSGKLRRRWSYREPKARFDLYCEGRKTEPGYFREIRKRLRSGGIVIRIHGIGGVPGEVARKAVAAAKGRMNKRDRVWAVFDRDAHPDFEEAISLCDAHGVGVARSNPCFELWLLLHLQEYDRPEDPSNLKAIWEGFVAQFGGETGFEALAANFGDAERRAAAQLDRRKEEGAPYTNPFTTVGDVTRALREASPLAGRLSE